MFKTLKLVLYVFNCLKMIISLNNVQKVFKSSLKVTKLNITCQKYCKVFLFMIVCASNVGKEL